MKKPKQVEPTTKDQPRANLIVATAKIVEALDPLYLSADRRRSLIAALAMLQEEVLMRSVMDWTLKGPTS